MRSAYTTALTGLKACSSKLQSNSSNIANASSNNFKKTLVHNTNTVPRGVKAQVQEVSSPGTSVFQQSDTGREMVELSHVDLAKELVDMKLNSTMYKANLKTLEIVNDMTGSLLNLKS